MIINREWSMPNSKTFKIKPIKNIINKYINNLETNSTIIDPFANEGNIKTDKHNIITNDIDTNYNTDYHKDGLDFLKMFESETIDIVLYDPPYSPRQVSEVYRKLGYSVNMKTTQSSYWSRQKKEVSRIVKKDGYVITCGWNSGGIGKTNGFEIVEILLVAHGGWHNDTIVTIERKIKENEL